MRKLLFLILVSYTSFSYCQENISDYPGYVFIHGDTLTCFTKDQGKQILTTYILLERYKVNADSMENLRSREIEAYKDYILNKNKEIEKVNQISNVKDSEIRILKKNYEQTYNTLKLKLQDDKPKNNWSSIFTAGAGGVLVGLVVAALIIK